MRLKRILFYTVLLLTTGCATASQNMAWDAVAYTGLSISQGFTTETQTQFSVVVPREKAFKYFIRSESNESDIRLREFTVRRETYGSSRWAVDHIFATHLEPNRIFRFEVRDATDTLLDSREFTTFSPRGNSIRFLAASCMDDKYHDVQSQIWPEALRREPEIIFLLGDNVYAAASGSKKSVRPSDLWRRYIETRLTVQLYRHPKLIPILAIWDDNDYGMPNGDRRYDYRLQSAEIFRKFFPQEPDMRHLWPGPGTSLLWRVRNQRFHLMDNRSFRSPNKVFDDDITHWGRAQTRWLFEEFESSNSPTWILNGNQIFGGYHSFESFQGSHPVDFNGVVDRLSKVRVPFVFLTGDRHNTEVMRVQLNKPFLRTFELTTSPIHARTYPSPWEETPNPLQIVGRAGVPNYMLIESENLNGDLRVRLTAYTINNKILFHEALWLSRDGRTLKVY